MIFFAKNTVKVVKHARGKPLKVNIKEQNVMLLHPKSRQKLPVGLFHKQTLQYTKTQSLEHRKTMSCQLALATERDKNHD